MWEDLFVSQGGGKRRNPHHGSCVDFSLHGMDAWFKSCQALLTSVRSRRFPRAVYVVVIMAAKFTTKLTFSQDDVTAAEKLEPAFESLLRSLKVNDAVIDAMRLNEITDRSLFTDLAQDENQLRKCAKAFGIDTSDDAEFPHQREMAKVVGAWRQAKAQSEVKTAADAAARAHGDPVTILTMDWNSLMEKFRVTFGPDLCDNELPAKSYCEEFAVSLAEGCLEAERLCEVEEQRKVKADPARQYGMHLDGKLTLQTRRKFTSVEPTNQEQLRAKFTVLQNMWLLAQLRQPGRSIFRDLIRSTFDDHLRILFNRKNFNYRKEVDRQLLSKPCWSHCLSTSKRSGRMRKLCRLQSIGITAALRQVISDNEHRTQHWVHLIAIANSSGANDAEIARLEKEVDELRSAVHRSRSLRMRPRQRALTAKDVGTSGSGKLLSTHFQACLLECTAYSFPAREHLQVATAHFAHR